MYHVFPGSSMALTEEQVLAQLRVEVSTITSVEVASEENVVFRKLWK